MKTQNLVSSLVSNYKVTHKELLHQCFSVLDNQSLGNSKFNKNLSHSQTSFMIVKKNVFFLKTACVITDNNLTEVDLQDRLSEIVEKTWDAIKVLSAQRHM